MSPSSSESEMAEVIDANIPTATTDEEHGAAVTGFTFAADQVAYMKEKLETYTSTPAKKRKRVIKRVYEHFKDQITRKEERPMDRNEDNLLFEGIRTWFKTAAKPPRKSKNQYGMTWYPRLVYIKMNGKRVKALAKRYVQGDFDIETFLEEYDSSVPDSDPSDNEGQTTKKKGKKGKKGGPGDWFFNHYQDAASDLMAQMSQEELDRYEKLAVKWSKQGPPPDIQAKNADKQAAKRGYTFSKDMHRDFNAITFSFVGWKREDGKPVAILSEFNKSLGRTVDFSVREQKAVKALFRAFRSYVYEELDEREDSDEEDADPLAAIAGQKHDLIPMVRNSYGEPFLPDITYRKRNIPRCDWLRGVLRSFFIYHYQLSGNFATPHDFRFPWTRILEEPRAFIDEDMMDDNILELLKEPSAMRVGPMLAVYNHLYEKQEKARTEDDAVDDLTFELKAYIDAKDDIVPRQPRVLSLGTDEWGEYDVLGEDKKPKKKSKEVSKKGLSNRSDADNRKRSTKVAKETEIDDYRKRASTQDVEDDALLLEEELADDEDEGLSVEEDQGYRSGSSEASEASSRDSTERLLLPVEKHSQQPSPSPSISEESEWSSWTESEDDMNRHSSDEEVAPEKRNPDDKASDEEVEPDVEVEESSATPADSSDDEGVMEVEQTVSSFKGVRTRNQKAMKARGIEQVEVPESASQIGRPGRRKEIFVLVDTKHEAKKGKDEHKKREGTKRDTHLPTRQSPRKARRAADDNDRLPSPSKVSRKRGADASQEPRASPSKRARTSTKESATTGNARTRNRRSVAVPATPTRNRKGETAQIRTPQTRAATKAAAQKRRR